MFAPFLGYEAKLAIVVWGEFPDKERELFGDVSACHELFREISRAVGVRKDYLNNVRTPASGEARTSTPVNERSRAYCSAVVA